jgi:hypothetical protein
MRTSGWFRKNGAASLLLPNVLALAGCYTGANGERSTAGQDAGESADDGVDDGVDDGSDTAGDDGPVGLCGDAEVGLTDLRRLTAAQYDNTIRDLLGIEGNPAAAFSADERVGPFKSNVAAPIGDLQAEQYMAAAEALGYEAVSDLNALLPCDPTAGEDACAGQFIAEFAPRAYRRPITDAEAASLLEVYNEGKTEADFTNGIRLVVQGVLQSPYFLYHVEFGTGEGSDGSIVTLTEHELASRLSYFLWDTMPDDELFAAADADELSTEEGMTAQVDRMLADPRARVAIASFHLQWLGVDEVEGVEKSPDFYPSFTPDLAIAMREETAAFASAVVLDGDGTLASLLTADYTYTEDPALLAMYGVTLPADHVPGDPVALPAGQRAGLLTQASVMTRHAHANQTSPVHRGKMVRENLLCQILAPPPPEVDNVPPSPDPDATTRERFEQHRADPSCAACHNLIDGFGFGFEHYDGMGAWRDMDGVNPVDATGWVIGTDFDGDFDGAVALAQNLASSELVAECVGRQWFRFAFGRVESSDDECTTDALDTAFAESGQDVKALIRQLVLSDSFRFRRATPVGAESVPGEGEVR